MIHSVIFTFKQGMTTEQQDAFFDAATALQGIEGVKNFQLYKQSSKKNPFQYGISMKFDTTSEFDNYNIHPAHQSFITTQWLPNVDHFLEIDYEPLSLDLVTNRVS